MKTLLGRRTMVWRLQSSSSFSLSRVLTPSPTYDKTVSNLQEVRARDGWVVAVAGDGDAAIAEHADAVLWVPVVAEGLAPIVNVIPMQLLAYEVAVQLGRDVDQPRNLAKSVTVE